MEQALNLVEQISIPLFSVALGAESTSNSSSSSPGRICCVHQANIEFTEPITQVPVVRNGLDGCVAVQDGILYGVPARF